MNRHALTTTALALLLAVMAVHVQANDKLDKLCGKFLQKRGVGSQEVSKVPESQDELAESVCLIYQGYKARDPGYLNKSLQPFIQRENGLRFLKDIHFKIRTFENRADENGLGFSYAYQKTFMLWENYTEKGDTTLGSTWDFNATGNVAFRSAFNPHDFLDTRMALTGFFNRGGIRSGFSEKFFGRLNDIEDRLASTETQDEYDSLQNLRTDFFNEIRSALKLQTYIDLNLNVGLECDQKFKQKQWSYGAQFALDIKGYNRKSKVAIVNLFDYPMALLRILSGYDEKFTPLGSTFPTFVLGLDQVDPTNHEVREALGETDKFNRFRTEVYIRSPIAYVGQSEVFLNIDIRYLRELDSSEAIEAEGLGRYRYRVISVSSSKGVFLTYTKGRLPFDLQDQEIYELGWKFHF